MTALRTTAPAARARLQPLTYPSPRDELDSGSVAELVEDSRAVHLDVARPRPWSQRHHDIAVPADAAALVEGLGPYGS